MKTLAPFLLLLLSSLPAGVEAGSLEGLRAGLQLPAFTADLPQMRALAAKGPRIAGAEVAPQPPAVLSCAEDPGARLCREADHLSDLFDYTCTGTACIALWRMQSRGLEELYGLYGRHVKPEQKVEKEMGKKFESLAKDICRMSFTGAEESMYELVIQINLTMPKLKSLQERAGIEKPRHCTFR
ncbi:MAG: hypothetical protein HY928_13145 [Elusimicrobia bacterium]|nr:hypothetical protein [Elusimicrobiota bacterium]